MLTIEHLKEELIGIKKDIASTEKAMIEAEKNPDFIKLTNEEKEKIMEMLQEQVKFFRSEVKRIKERIKNLSK